jgi:hypothetical protein
MSLKNENKILEKINQLLEQAIQSTQPQKKVTVVKFDSSTPNPWEVKFSKRGFLISGTRLSFEELERAISKNYSIELKDGTKLDAVKMQKILKYKDLY